MAADLYLTEARRMPEERRLRLTWSDGHSAAVAYDRLRGYCPCAGCQGHTNRAIVYRPPARAVDAAAIEPVGNYAISIRWSDGHGTGIYRFDYLRRLCSCDRCREERGEEPGATPPIERLD